MKLLRRLLATSVLVVHLSGCAADGSVCGDGKECDPGKTALFLLGGAALVGGAYLAAKSCTGPGCEKGFYDGLSGNKNLTGGPYWDWDRFSNGQYRCRDIDNGKFVKDSLCSSMPKDDDRWP
jgi:hypothetical protein